MNTKYATFAGGCFWCMVPPFKELEGVLNIEAGYTGGVTKNPTYEEINQKDTGHYEAVRIRYNPSVVKYKDLLEIFWRQIDPTDEHGQFADKGPQYKTAIFYHDEEQKQEAIKSKENIERSGIFSKPIITEILAASEFYSAEDYHQDYHLKNPTYYTRYKIGSGRDAFIKSNLKKRLTPLQYKVTQEDGTEPPFDNEFWDNEEDGIYVDIVSGKPLFSSLDKFDAGCGWPSFTKPIDKDVVKYKEDTSFNMSRTEVRSKQSDSHLGHVFEDGPKPTGQRFCINSAALRFIPKDNLVKEGYEEYLALFGKNS